MRRLIAPLALVLIAVVLVRGERIVRHSLTATNGFYSVIFYQGANLDPSGATNELVDPPMPAGTINTNLNGVLTVPQSYLKIDSTNREVFLLTAPEIAALEATNTINQTLTMRAYAQDIFTNNSPQFVFTRAMLLTILDEINTIRANINSASPLSARTVGQLTNAIKSKITSGAAEQ